MITVTNTTHPISETLAFKADLHLIPIEEAMRGINVVATVLLNRSDDNKALVNAIWSIVEDIQDNLRDLRKLIEDRSESA